MFEVGQIRADLLRRRFDGRAALNAETVWLGRGLDQDGSNKQGDDDGDGFEQTFLLLNDFVEVL